MGFPRFLALLTDLSCKTSDLSTYMAGLTLSDGPWQYRMAKVTQTELEQETRRCEWRMLKSHADFDIMLQEVAYAPEACVEVQHSSRQPRPLPLPLPLPLPQAVKKTAQSEMRAAHFQVQSTQSEVRVAHSQVKPTQSEVRVAHSQVKPTQPEVKAAHAQAMPAEKPSPFAIWEQYRWPPFIVDSGIIDEAQREERLEGIHFGKASKVEPMDLGKARE
ncbi:hypothetical protein A1O3_02805 [Capronia epimyces CBS 606.96]|uniref:Uncharacterized protein n=1 Tax=Capronia epimyces CBS 606.96 TaxID=1182542 RepID=W9YB33_9EURO|nr:uncharacterized protein A1O3_02805 [Capronia epimyces CBS 606.96]EXJ89738.1 hypothetical protein A1O3_02805 [Capronia epimyces CBS 606.96]